MKKPTANNFPAPMLAEPISELRSGEARESTEPLDKPAGSRGGDSTCPHPVGCISPGGFSADVFPGGVFGRRSADRVTPGADFDFPRVKTADETWPDWRDYLREKTNENTNRKMSGAAAPETIRD